MHLLFLITIKKEQLAANVEKLHTSFVLWCLIYAMEKGLGWACGRFLVQVALGTKRINCIFEQKKVPALE